MITCTIELHDIGNTCPICGEQALDAAFDERDGDDYEDTYKCQQCGALVTYISRDDGRAYHEYHDGEIEIELEWSIPHMPPESPVEDVKAMLDDIIGREEAAENDQCYEFMIELVQRAKALKARLTSDNPSSGE